MLWHCNKIRCNASLTESFTTTPWIFFNTWRVFSWDFFSTWLHTFSFFRDKNRYIEQYKWQAYQNLRSKYIKNAEEWKVFPYYVTNMDQAACGYYPKAMICAFFYFSILHQLIEWFSPFFKLDWKTIINPHTSKHFSKICITPNKAQRN